MAASLASGAGGLEPKALEYKTGGLWPSRESGGEGESDVAIF
jgi:hypothetical protein